MARQLEPAFVGRACGDFLFRPQSGLGATRRAPSLRSRRSGRSRLEMPSAAANMDSVTGARMAKTMALEGGIGIVHRGMTIEAQAESVGKVKRSHGHVVEQPLSLPRGTTVREAREFTRRHNITGILIEESR